MKAKKMVTLAIITSLSIVFSIIESFIPTGLPGLKLGLANIATIIIIYLYSLKEGAIVHFVRIFIVGLIYSGIFSQTFFLSLSGGTISFLVMIFLFYLFKTSVITLSIPSSIAHVVGQIAFASVILKSSSLFLYLPVLFVMSIITGSIVGVISFYILKSLKEELVKPKIKSYVILSSVLVLSFSIFIIFKTYSKKADEGTVAILTYQNQVLLEINLENPKKKKIIDQELFDKTFIEEKKYDDSYIYVFNIYNKDEKNEYELVIEIVNSEIRIKSETSNKHICSNMGFIKNKFESLVCLPNSFIITLKNLKLDEIDYLI